MSSLTRTASGRFLIEDAVKLDELKEIAKNGGIDSVLITPDRALADYKKNNGRQKGGKIFI